MYLSTCMKYCQAIATSTNSALPPKQRLDDSDKQMFYCHKQVTCYIEKASNIMFHITRAGHDLVIVLSSTLLEHVYSICIPLIL